MPSLRIDGLDKLVAEMERDAAKTAQRMDRMLLAGAEAVKEGWKQSAREHDLIDTGEMLDSIDYNNKIKKSGDIKYVEIYPMGKRKGSKPNAEVAYVLHYGTRGTSGWRARLRLRHKKYPGQPGMPATLWVDRAEELGAQSSLDAMMKIWKEE